MKRVGTCLKKPKTKQTENQNRSHHCNTDKSGHHTINILSLKKKKNRTKENSKSIRMFKGKNPPLPHNNKVKTLQLENKRAGFR